MFSDFASANPKCFASGFAIFAACRELVFVRTAGLLPLSQPVGVAEHGVVVERRCSASDAFRLSALVVLGLAVGL
jgi:hypothetical protein